MLSCDERDEVCLAVETLKGALERLTVRGLRAAGPDDLRSLDVITSELRRVGADHMAEKTHDLVAAVRADDRGAPEKLMRAFTSVRVFERVLTLSHVASLLEAADAAEKAAAEEADDAVAAAPPPPAAKGKKGAKAKAAPPPAAAAKTGKPAKPGLVKTSAPPPPPPPPPLTLADAQKLVPLLEDLSRAVEDLLASGLTTASAATREKLDVSFREASRLRLLRLGAALRFVNEEIGRFLAESAEFAARRLAFFLNRAWLLARGLARAARTGDAALLGRLLLSPPTAPLPKVTLALQGVQKRVVRSSASCSFDFRFRVLADAPPLRAGQRLLWSCVYSQARADAPAEAFLHLPQPQRFRPIDLLDGRAIVVEKAAVSLDETGGGRLQLGPQSTVAPVGEPLEGLAFRPPAFDMAEAAARLRAHRPGPLDLEAELNEEVLLEGWTVGDPEERAGRADQVVYPVRARGLDLDAVVSKGPDGNELRAALDAARSNAAGPLFGVAHYELCRIVLQPIAVLEEKAPRQLMLSSETIDAKTLKSLTQQLMGTNLK